MIDCTKLSLITSNEQVEILQVKIKFQANKGSLVVGVYYRLPDKGEPADEVFLLLLQEASITVAGSDPAGELQSHWHLLESSSVSCKQARRLFECIKYYLLIHMIV